MRHALVLGGARSGKTAFGERLALHAGRNPLYLAMTQTLDADMRERIESHRAGRTGRFATSEEPLLLSRAILKAGKDHDTILVDSLSLWITNLLMANADVATAVSELCATLVEFQEAKVILVSQEVGLGVEPENAMARTFRDLAGSAHQRLAEVCDDVYFVAAGLPLTMKGAAPMADA